MKKTARILSTVCASAIALSMCSMFSATASAASAVRIMGDLNNDMIVDAQDAQTTLGIYVDALTGLGSDDATDKNETGDINMDGKISVEDATSILSYYCQTLVGGQPLWADFRTVSYQNGNGFLTHEKIDPETGEPVLDENGKPVLEMSNRIFALRGMYVEIGCAAGKAGETVTVPIYVAGVPELAGFQLTVTHELPLKLTDITSKINEQPGWDAKYECSANPSAADNQGILVAAQANNISLADGFVIGEFTYQIPKDAASGTHYAIEIDPSWTKFVSKDCTYTAADGKHIENGAYQYTALSGVVTVQ